MTSLIILPSNENRVVILKFFGLNTYRHFLPKFHPDASELGVLRSSATLLLGWIQFSSDSSLRM